MTPPTPVLAAQDLVEITADVWSAFLLAEDDVPLLPTAPGAPAEDAVHATVEVSGSWAGRVDLVLDGPSADRATRALLRLDAGSPVAPDDVFDAVGELANMVGGNVKSLAPEPSRLGLPAVGRGPLPDGGVVECEADLDWGGSVVRVVVRSV